MVTRGIREFMSRDWDAARRRKDRYWANRIAQLGILEGYRASDELRRQALMLDPAWPPAGSRREDVAAHECMSRLLARFDAARRR